MVDKATMHQCEGLNRGNGRRCAQLLGPSNMSAFCQQHIPTEHVDRLPLRTADQITDALSQAAYPLTKKCSRDTIMRCRAIVAVAKAAASLSKLRDLEHKVDELTKMIKGGR